MQLLNSSRLSRNTLILLANNGGSAILSFVLSVFIGRAAGQDGLGVYATTLAWVYPLSLISEFGLGTLITRDVAQNPTAAVSLLTTTTRARLLLGGGMMIMLAIAAPLLSDDAAVVKGLQISAPLIIIGPFFGAFTAIFRARQWMWPIAWLNLGMLVAQVILTILVVVAGGGVLAVLVVNVATSAGQLIAAWVVYRARFGVTSAQDVSFRIYQLLLRAWPFALAAILAAIQMRISVILLEVLVGTGEVGYYAASNRFVEAGRMIPNALFGALFPVLASRPQESNPIFVRMMWGLVIYGGGLAAGLTLFASLVVQVTYGAQFTPAVPILQLAIWSLLPSLLCSGRTLYWYAHNREEFVNRVTAFTLVLQVALSLWLIPLYGASGVAFCILAVETVAFILLTLGTSSENGSDLQR